MDAWKSYDGEASGALLSADCDRYHPWDDPLRGRDAIVADWLRERDERGSFDARHEPWVVDRRRAVGTGTSRYDEPRGDRVYHNVFLLEFDDEGACRSFTESFILP